MAACGFGALSLKLSNLKLDSGRTKLIARQTVQNGLIIQNNTRFEGLLLSQRWKKPLTRCRCSASEAESAINSEEDSEEAISSRKISPLFPNSYEVESLLTEICDTMSIAEFELKLGGFRLYVARDLTGKGNTPPPPISAPVSIATDAKAPDSNGSAYSESLAISKTLPPSNGVQTLLNKVADEGLVILQSPRVGYFRRSRTIKGKRAPQSCKEKQIVKEGQVICYIEQLGGELPVESDISGEVIKILREDGDPVGYGDALIAILPSFPGIKKLQ